MRYSPGYTLTIATDPKRVPVETVRIQMSGVSMETEEIDLIATTEAPAVNNVESRSILSPQKRILAFTLYGLTRNLNRRPRTVL